MPTKFPKAIALLVSCETRMPLVKQYPNFRSEPFQPFLIFSSSTALPSLTLTLPSFPSHLMFLRGARVHKVYIDSTDDTRERAITALPFSERKG